MHISDELVDFCTGFLENLTDHDLGPQDRIIAALLSVHKERLPIFENYLEGLLLGDHSDTQLKELIGRAGTDAKFLDVHYPRQFLEMVRDTIGEILKPGAPGNG